jgi:hypothetical protein
MATEVMPLHYVTVAFRLYDEKQENQAMKPQGSTVFSMVWSLGSKGLIKDWKA